MFGAGIAKSGLLELNLSNNALGDASIKALAFSIGSSQLQKLYVVSTKMSYHGAKPLF